MKTWRQLEAMAKRQGKSLDHRARFCAIDEADSATERVVVTAYYADAKINDRILRAMVEAALREGR